MHSLACCQQGAVTPLQHCNPINVRLSQAAVHALADELKSAPAREHVHAIQLHNVGVLQVG